MKAPVFHNILNLGEDLEVAPVAAIQRQSLWCGSKRDAMLLDDKIVAVVTVEDKFPIAVAVDH